jgi:hypothetical protein
MVTIVQPTFRIFELQMGADAPTPPFPAALGFSCRRPATEGNETLGSLPCRRFATAYNDALGTWKLPVPHPRFPLCSAFVLQTAGYRGQRNAWLVATAALKPSLPAALGFCLADGSLPRATKCLAGGGCRPHTPAIRCARLLLQTARYRGQRSAW